MSANEPLKSHLPQTLPAHFELRTLLPIDSQDLRSIRLEALQHDGKFFASSYEVESKFSPTVWEQKCSEDKEHCVIGLFYDADLIGISMVSKWDGDPTGRTALFGSSYIKPEFRGLKLGSFLYAKRLEWADQYSQFDQAVVFHRDGNTVSKELNSQHGSGELVETKPMKWGDGKEAKGYWYKIELHKPNTPAPSSRHYQVEKPNIN